MKLVLGALLTSVVVFIWGFLSWTVLTWHEAGMHGFHDEEATAALFMKNAQAGHAIYTLPALPQPPKGTSREEQEAIWKKHEEAKETGPFVYAIIRPHKAELNMTKNMLFAVVRGFICALFLGFFLKLIIVPYSARVGLCGLAGLFASLVCDLPMWIWFESPGRDLFVNIVDHLIEWSLGGLVLAAFVGTSPTAATDRR